MKTEISEIILRIHKNLTGNQLSVADVDLMLHASRRCDVLFVFIRGIRYPEYIVKLSRDAANKTRLANEVAALTFLESLACDSLKDTVPVALFEGIVQCHYMIVETFLKGISLNEKLYACRNSKKEIARIFSIVTDWVIVMHSKTASSPQSVPEFLDSGFWLESLAKYTSSNPQGLPGEYRGQVDALLDRSRGLPDCAIRPRVRPQ